MERFLDTIEKVKSGVIRITSIKNNNIAGSGTGFISNNRIITNDHVLKGALSGETVWLTFHDTPISKSISNGKETVNAKPPILTLSKQDFKKLVITSSEENFYDYAILSLPEAIQKMNLFQFELLENAEKKMGMDIAFLGYPLDAFNITCHSGRISSLFSRGIVDNVIQIDASINGGNSGGPLFMPDTGKVVGIITRKATGITKMFDELKNGLRQNMELINNSSGANILMGGIDLRRAIEATQLQSLVIIEEIERSANVGIGYAFPIDPVTSALK